MEFVDKPTRSQKLKDMNMLVEINGQEDFGLTYKGTAVKQGLHKKNSYEKKI